MPARGIRSSYTYLPECSSTVPAIRRLRIVCQATNAPERTCKSILFLRGLEDEKHHSPFFGICALKRFSRVSTRDLPLSRETFNASDGTVVKSNFRGIWLGIQRAAGSYSTKVDKSKIKLQLMTLYCLDTLACFPTVRGSIFLSIRPCDENGPHRG